MKGRFKMHSHYKSNSQDFKTRGRHLTFDDRRNIQRWHREGKSNREIARLLGKSPQTINNEINRGKVRQQVRKGKFERIYSYEYAHGQYCNNRKHSVKLIKLTSEMKEVLVYYLKQMKYSPEMISKRNIVNVPISTIYYWIHHGHLGLSSEDLLYPRKKKAKRKEASPAFRPKGKSIEERPEAINQRKEAGHFEIDTVILKRKKGPCLLVLTDRRTRIQMIRLIPDKTATSVNIALQKILKSHEIKSITADNGSEFFRLFDVFPYEDIYFAHPYSSHERGTNENHNRLIRRFFPKGTSEVTELDVKKVENWINHYPKKIFNYKTPFEMSKMGG